MFVYFNIIHFNSFQFYNNYIYIHTNFDKIYLIIDVQRVTNKYKISDQNNLIV